MTRQPFAAFPAASPRAHVRWGDWGAAGLAGSLFTPRMLGTLLTALALSLAAGEAYAQLTADRPRSGAAETLIKWAPLILLGPPGEIGGFLLNILVSFLVMAIGTVTGVILGLIQLSRSALLSGGAWAVTQFFRNSPWLVLLFFAMLLLPFRLSLFGVAVPFPDWLKATIGLALPIMANISEVTRGAVNSIPTSQWESAESLAFTRGQSYRLIILPQCVKRMTPPWMNWYAILTMATPLISIVGVSDSMTLTQDALAAEGRSELLIPMYLMLLMFFFVYCYPIARWTLAVERRFAVAT